MLLELQPTHLGSLSVSLAPAALLLVTQEHQFVWRANLDIFQIRRVRRDVILVPRVHFNHAVAKKAVCFALSDSTQISKVNLNANNAIPEVWQLQMEL